MGSHPLKQGCSALAFTAAVVAASTPTSVALGNDLRVETRSVDRSANTGARVTAKVSWKNAWRNARNHDAVWLFVKVRPGPNAGWRHVKLAATPRGAASLVSCEPSADHVGAFCRAAAA